MGHGAAVLHGGCWGSAAQIVMQAAAPGLNAISTVGDSEDGHLANLFAPNLFAQMPCAYEVELTGGQPGDVAE
jgi:hypothetical protein